MSRIGWLLSHPEFRKHPVRVSSGVVSWEIHKLLSRNMALELDGLKLTARPIDGNGRLICYFGTKFDTIFDFLKTYLKPGMVFADVGANIGSHAINAARLVGGTGSVFAFEADPDTYRLLARNIQSNGLRNIELRQTCVSDHVGTLSFYKHKDSAKSSIVDRGEKLSVTLPSDTLDNLIPDNMRIDVLKVDVEGAELSVLRGATGVFTDERRPSVVIIEVFDVRDNTDRSEGIREVLEGYGYEFYLFDGHALTPLSGSALNAFAVHKSVRPQVLAQFSSA
ncbi:MAG TPA: FkbM family methyltransferase [Roseiarcus sp.]|jgi:FkbM family methyltransferase